MEIELPNGQIAEFPDDMPHEQIESVLREHFPMQSEVPSIGMQSKEQPGAFSNFFHGVAQGYPHALKSDINAVSELAGRHPFDVEELNAEPFSQRLGQGVGQIGGHLSAILPAALAAQAAIPGLAGATIGAGLAGAATTPGGWKERLSSGLLEAAIPAGFKAAKEGTKLGLAALRRAPTPRKAADVIQKSHEAAHQFATTPLREAEQEAAKINKPIRLSDKLLTAAEDALQKTKANKTLIDNAKKGDYKSVFKLQSDLWKRGQSFASKQTQAEVDRGHEIFDLRNSLLKGMKTHYDYLGNNSVGKNLAEGQQRFKNFADLYLTNPTVSKLVGKEKIVPKNLLSKLESDTAYFNKLKEEIPGIGKMLELQKSKAKLKNAGKTVGALSYGGGIAKYLLGIGDHHSRDNQ